MRSSERAPASSVEAAARSRLDRPRSSCSAGSRPAAGGGSSIRGRPPMLRVSPPGPGTAAPRPKSSWTATRTTGWCGCRAGSAAAAPRRLRARASAAGRLRAGEASGLPARLVRRGRGRSPAASTYVRGAYGHVLEPPALQRGWAAPARGRAASRAVGGRIRPARRDTEGAVAPCRAAGARQPAGRRSGARTAVRSLEQWRRPSSRGRC